MQTGDKKGSVEELCSYVISITLNMQCKNFCTITCHFLNLHIALKYCLRQSCSKKENLWCEWMYTFFIDVVMTLKNKKLFLSISTKSPQSKISSNEKFINERGPYILGLLQKVPKKCFQIK